MAAPPIAVFDLDGTLAETAGDLIGTLNVLLRREGLAELPLSQARELIGAGAKALIRRGFEAEGRSIGDAEHERLFDAFIAHYGEHLADSSHLFDGVVEALDRLEQSGFRLAVCTNKYEGQSVKLLNLLGIADRFAAICGRDTFPQAKPDPRHLTGTIAQAGGDPARAVMVGDSRTDIDTAKAAGIPVVAVTFGYTDTPVADLAPDRVIEHFSELHEAVVALVPAG
ncbi:phosphoglycolate phosphatase [Methylobacterium persicinum]|uniref:Phosphoglycolate phosphatase n=1 Tax=Methylobacterium persicinum TaxID=374426 RepID=A0ABU0HHT6_9HYPH|nr:phosphoglycolate phosphatase [Methylobacterium persicinum]MDQ0441892.1 phosphoglycolate phosphatase [Methylobacterium persicinum]GJE39124.1 N-acetylmuramic acid 6-phosphate phosphatase [Methylobacterium persicinum]